jgi:ribosomal-protein-alanine N-acetyltransferase
LIAFDSYASPFIASERLILEPLSAGHAERLFASFSDPELYTYLPSDPPGSLEAMRERYRRLEARRSTDGKALWLNWAAREESGSYVGVVEATVHADATAHVAYFVFRPFQRQGFAAEAVEAVLAHLKNDIGVREARALLDTRNEASWRLLERLGFKRSRTITDADHFKGSVSDEYEYVRHL